MISSARGAVSCFVLVLFGRSFLLLFFFFCLFRAGATCVQPQGTDSCWAQNMSGGAPRSMLPVALLQKP